MDSVDVCTASSAGDKKRRVNKKNSVWHKRLHLRKTAVRPPAMQSEDKQHGPKKIAEEWEQSTAWPSSQKPPQETRQSRRRTNDSRNTLRFTCSQCKDSVEYVPKDLVRHFEEKHRGSPPVFSCHTCTFSTPEFSYLQVHLLNHKDTFSGCSICNDNVQRTWPEFSAHLTMCHCLNGKYSCEMCQKFSTGDVRGFLEHIFVHNLEGTDDLPLHINGPKTTTQTCQHCGYEASQKWLITKHIKAVHVCQNGSQRKKTAEAHSMAVKPNDSIPKMKPRLTRSAVREMCWLTQDCLSLPGREFLDKYCHLSDPQTTLEETQQFLMKSVETGDQKWTNALKTVLSNVPQDMNLHPKSENGIMSNSSDLTVLTVKNKITVAQNGATYAKRLKMMTSSDKDAVSPASAADDTQCAVDLNGCPSDLIDHTPEHKLHGDVLQSEPSERAHTQENRENQEVKTEQETAAPVHSDGVHVFSELKLSTDGEEQTSVHKALPKKRRKTRRWKRKTRFKKVVKTSPGLVLKLVLKKNPVKQKQWVSQSPLSAEIDGQHRVLNPHTATEVEAVLQDLQTTEEDQKKQTKTDPSKAISSPQQSNPGGDFSTKNMTEDTAVVLEDRLLIDEEVQEDAEKSELAGETSRTISRAPSVTDVEMSPENARPRTPHNGTKCPESAGGLAINRAATPLSQPAITSQDQVNVRDPGPVVSAEQSVEGVTDREEPADSCSDLLSSVHVPAGKAIQQEPSPASGHRWQPAPKTLVRTLKLVAINPSQLVKRPAGDQPVVVLNHPDVDIPEVARIMEVVNRYREVQKVVLSRRTLLALKGETDAQPEPARRGENSVQERFTLKLKFRRLSRKKYEIVGAASPSRDAEKKFRCWFCGRLFACQQTWMTHRQRHLVDWNGTNCEKNS